MQLIKTGSFVKYIKYENYTQLSQGNMKNVKLFFNKYSHSQYIRHWFLFG